MTLSFQTFKVILLTIVGVFMFTTLFGFTAFLPAQEVKAQWVVTDWIQEAGNWIRSTGERLWEEASQFVTNQFNFDSIKWSKVAESLWEHTKTFLAGLAIKLAINALQVTVSRIIDRNKINNYLTYIDRVTRYVYALDKIQNDPDYDPADARMLKLLILGGSSDKWGNIMNNAEWYQAINEKIGTTGYCNTYNLYPQDPDYYGRLLRSKSPECTPAFVAAAAVDSAMSIVGEAQQAAQTELYSSQGFKSVRDCGTIETEVAVRETAPDIRKNSAGINVIQPIKTEEFDTGELDLAKSGYALVCSSILQPGAYVHDMVDNMVQVILDRSTDPKETSTGDKVANFLSSVFANSLTNLMFCGEAGSILDNVYGANAGQCTDFDFNSQIPRIDADDAFQGNYPEQGKPDTYTSRDEQQLRSFWNDFCQQRLPLMMAWKNGNYVKEQIPAIGYSPLRNGQILFLDHEREDYLPSQGRLQQLFGANNGLSVERMLNIPLDIDEFRDLMNLDEDFNAWISDRGGNTFPYVWALHDPITDGVGAWHFDDSIALARTYFMGVRGYPTAEDVKESTLYIPQGWQPSSTYWRYFIDDGNRGYLYDFGANYGAGEFYHPEGYKIATSTRDATASKAYTYQNGNVSTTYDQVVVFETRTGEYVALSGRSNSGRITDAGAQLTEIRMWKLDKNVSVVAEEGKDPVTYLDGLKLSSGSSTAMIEFTGLDGSRRVYSAKEMFQQKPCYSEPFGPPVNLQDLGTKLKLSRGISDKMWNWVFEKTFIQNNRTP